MADADCATPLARMSDGSAIVATVQISEHVNNRSISVKPDSPLTVFVLLTAMAHQGHFSALLPFFDNLNSVVCAGVWGPSGSIRAGNLLHSNDLHQQIPCDRMDGLQGGRQHKAAPGREAGLKSEGSVSGQGRGSPVTQPPARSP